MNQARVGLLLAAALFAAPLNAAAQPAKSGAAAAKPDKAGADKAGGEKAGGDKSGAQTATGDQAGGDQPSGDQPAGDQPAGDQPAGDQPTGENGEASGVEELCKISGDCPTIDWEKEAAKPLNPDMYAMQQRYVLHQKRVEINPYFALTMNDQFVSHPAAGLAINYYITNSIAVGVNGHIYGNTPSNFNFQTSRAARVGEPITEYQWNANANFTYVPAYGKFAGFGDFIFHYDLFLVGGVGATSTRPIAVVDPDNRTFSFTPRITFNVGGGLRIFFNRWLALTAEVRDYIFPEDLENPAIAAGNDARTGKPNAQKESTWLSPDTSITNNVQAQVGLSLFLPFSWEYHKPR